MATTKGQRGASHKTLRVTPAMAAGLADRVFDMTDLVALIEQAEAPQPASLSGASRNVLLEPRNCERVALASTLPPGAQVKHA